MKFEEFQRTYSEDYFHGVGSGYPKEGYEEEHPTWFHWINVVKKWMELPIKWLDLGCAYGYLISEALDEGVDAYGIDVSNYALTKLPRVKDRMALSMAEILPFKDESFHVVSAFDLLEHLEYPSLALCEIKRVLKEGGLFIGATPDPMFFRREEPTHINQRSPEDWIRDLLALGFQLNFRFFGGDYNFEFLSLKGESSKGNEPLEYLRHDFFGQGKDVFPNTFLPSKDGFSFRLRKGFTNLDYSFGIAPFRKMNSSASLYLLNLSQQSLSLAGYFRFKSTCPVHELWIERGKEKVKLHLNEKMEGEYLFQFPHLSLPKGGHEAKVEFKGAEVVDVVEIQLKAKGFMLGIEEFVLCLPFDLYHRYRAGKEIIERLKSLSPRQRLKVLDIGGWSYTAYHDHFLPAQAFLPDEDVVVVDKVPCPLEGFARGSGLYLPFKSSSFDVVMAIDVLEHIPQEDRPSFIQEMVRVSSHWILLATPIANRISNLAEEILKEFIGLIKGQRQMYLEEHLEYGLPNLDMIRESLTRLNLNFTEIPSGYLPRWLLMNCIKHYLNTIPESLMLHLMLDRFYNLHHWHKDFLEPAYRRLFLISKERDRDGLEKVIDKLNLDNTEGIAPGEMDALKILIHLMGVRNSFSYNQELISQKKMVEERDARILELGNKIKTLEEYHRSLENYCQNLWNYSKNLEEKIFFLKKIPFSKILWRGFKFLRERIK